MTAQIRLWKNCNNGCSFCYLNENRHIINKEEKINRLVKAKELSSTIRKKYDSIGLIGGDFFLGELFSIENYWFDLISYIDSLQFNCIWIATALTSDNLKIVYDTINCIQKSNYLICTSFDPKGRFTEKTLKIWYHNIYELSEKNIPINITMIPTEDLYEYDINVGLNFPKNVSVNLCDPHLGLLWYANIDKKDYHNCLVRDNKTFNLIKREHFLKFLYRNKKIINNYVNYATTHSSDVFDIDADLYKDYDYIYKNRTSVSNKYAINECGHPYFSMCYSDSNKCAMCDAERLLNEEF